jgi:hypothetical protein
VGCEMDVGVITTAVVAVIAVVLGFIFEKERDRKAKLHERKEDLYKNLVFSLKGFFQKRPDSILKQEFVDETRLARLYASDEAIKALNKFVDIMQKTEKEFKEETGEDYQKVAHYLLGEFIKAMRKDLGIKTELSAEELGRTEIIK